MPFGSKWTLEQRRKKNQHVSFFPIVIEISFVRFFLLRTVFYATALRNEQKETLVPQIMFTFFFILCICDMFLRCEFNYYWDLFFSRVQIQWKKKLGIFVNSRFWIDLNETQLAHTANRTWPYGIRSADNFIYMHTAEHHADGVDRKEQVVEAASLTHFYMCTKMHAAKTNDPIDRIDNVCLVRFFLSLSTCLLSRLFAVYLHFFHFYRYKSKKLTLNLMRICAVEFKR